MPNPLIDKHVFYNEAVEELFNSSVSLMDINSFKSYVLAQRQLRWEIKCAVENIENLIVKYRDSKDGIWVNCRRFTSAEDVKCHTANDLVMAVGTKDAISNEIRKIEIEEEKLAKRRSQLFCSNNTIPCWKSSELEYYDISLKKMNETKSFLMKLESQIQSLIRKYEHNFPENMLNKQKDKRQRKRRLENDRKSEKRKEMRLYRSCASVLNSITYHGLFSDAAARGDFGFNIDNASINPHALDTLKPKMHLRGLKHLIEKGVFVNDGSSNIAKTFSKHLQEQLESTMEANRLHKARRMKKPRYGTIAQCFQTAGLKMTEDSNITENDESNESSSESCD